MEQNSYERIKIWRHLKFPLTNFQKAEQLNNPVFSNWEAKRMAKTLQSFLPINTCFNHEQLPLITVTWETRHSNKIIYKKKGTAKIYTWSEISAVKYWDCCFDPNFTFIYENKLLRIMTNFYSILVELQELSVLAKGKAVPIIICLTVHINMDIEQKG